MATNMATNVDRMTEQNLTFMVQAASHIGGFTLFNINISYIIKNIMNLKIHRIWKYIFTAI